MKRQDHDRIYLMMGPDPLDLIGLRVDPLQNCGVAASPRMVDDKAPGSQVRLGSDNAAMVMLV